MIAGQVYMIRHNVTGKMYIGRSQDVKKRTAQHFTMLRAGRHPVEDMQDDYNKHGDDYTVTILGEATATNKLEIRMQDKYQSCVRGIGYNYKDPHVSAAVYKKAMKQSEKMLLHRLIDNLKADQITYAYTFLTKMFGEAPNAERKEQPHGKDQ